MRSAKPSANGGRLIYVGAGTSGRIAALDAAECPPTFNTDPETVQFIMAGGVRRAVEPVRAGRRFRRVRPTARWRAASPARRMSSPASRPAGARRSPSLPWNMRAARARRTIAITCNPDTPLGRAADIEIVVEVGPEVLTGSTRMKAGTAQKLICNMITTGAMARAGYVYGNLMVNVHPKNEKLVARGGQHSGNGGADRFRARRGGPAGVRQQRARGAHHAEGRASARKMRSATSNSPGATCGAPLNPPSR